MQIISPRFNIKYIFLQLMILIVNHNKPLIYNVFSWIDLIHFLSSKKKKQYYLPSTNWSYHCILYISTCTFFTIIVPKFCSSTTLTKLNFNQDSSRGFRNTIPTDYCVWQKIWIGIWRFTRQSDISVFYIIFQLSQLTFKLSIYKLVT